MEKTDWDGRFMNLAKEARSWTKGLGAGVDRGVGACVVSPSRRQFSLGFAGFPRGVADTAERLASPKFRANHTIHAELNAILNAGANLEGWTMYVTECPCVHCACAIAQAGIKRLVAPNPNRGSNWYGSQLEGAETLRKAGVIIDRVSIVR